MNKKEEQFKRDNYEETKQGMKEINQIIFKMNEELPEDWTDFPLTAEEVKILKEGEDYIDKVLVPNLSIYRKVTKRELMDDERPIKDNQQPEKEEISKDIEIEKEFTEAEMVEINNLLKQKTKALKVKIEKSEKDKYDELKTEEEKQKQEEIARLNREEI